MKARVQRSLLGLFLVLVATASHACSCIEYLGETKEAFVKSALVFSGEVTAGDTVMLPHVVYELDKNHNFIPSQYLDRRGLFTFRVLKQWKGTPAKTYVVLAASPEKPLPGGLITVDCDVHFELGKQYLVFATEGYSEANPCAPTGPLASKAEIVGELDQLITKARQ